MRSLANTITALSFVACIGASSEANACGGLFCSASNPVNQAAERIIFAQDGERVHAVIEIQYQGPSSSFAWILPVPGGEAVDVGVSSRQALDALQQQSNPQYNLVTTFEQCPFDGADDDFSDDVAGDDDAPSEPEPAAEPDAVLVVAAGSVGPYDYVQLAVDESLPNAADVAVNWLEENAYDVSNVGAGLLGGYLESGLDLIAFKLTKGNDVGSIRPIALSWSADYPVIPIRPTAVAANDDMGILVWVLGEARAVPTNYYHLELNEAKINWFNPGPTYNDVVIAAADEAGGQGFVTEQSTEAGSFRNAILPSSLEDRFETLRTGDFPSLESFFQSVLSSATTFNPTTFEQEFYDGFLEVMSDSELLPLREGATAEQLVACVSCYFAVDVPVRNDRYPATPYDPETDPIQQMNVSAFLDGLEEGVLTPMRETRALFRPELTVTRLYTTLSADEMTVDPAFDFNADLDPVDNIHTADRHIQCDGTQSITLPQGMVVVAPNGFSWPVTVDDELPMNFRIVQLSTTGPGAVAIDNSERIAQTLTDLDIGGVVSDDDPGNEDPPEGNDDVPVDDLPVPDDDATGDDATGDDDAAAGDDDATADDDMAAGDDDMAADDDGDNAAANDAVVSEGCGLTPRHRGHTWWLLAWPLALFVLTRRGLTGPSSPSAPRS